MFLVYSNFLYLKEGNYYWRHSLNDLIDKGSQFWKEIQGPFSLQLGFIFKLQGPFSLLFLYWSFGTIGGCMLETMKKKSGDSTHQCCDCMGFFYFYN